MKESDFSVIYNIPEAVSGLGYIGYFICICLYIALALFAVPDILSDNNWLKDNFDLIISAGFGATLGMAFIFILCPIYFIIGFVKEIFRAIKSKREFYSNPNIEYIKLNHDNLFFKNTCMGCDFTIQKSDVERVLLTGKVNTFFNPVGKGSARLITYVENLTMTIKTTKGEFLIYPDVKFKQVKRYYSNQIDLIRQQIQFYKSYFDNFNVCFDSDGNGTIAELQSIVTAYELETQDTVDKKRNYWNIIFNIILLGAFVYYIFKMFFF